MNAREAGGNPGMPRISLRSMRATPLAASHLRSDRPSAGEHVVLGVDGFGPERRGAVRQVIETDIRILGDRNSAVHEQDEVVSRSEERRVGKEGRSRWSPYH